MDILNLIKTRRSIRKFKNAKIDDESINTLLESAMYAPSARNEQPWHFIVVEDKDVLQKITEVHPHAKMLLEASHAIVVVANINLERSTGNWPVDCAAATQNILLTAHSMGIGSVWLGVYSREERMEGIKTLFNLPENVKPFSIIALGFPNEEIETPKRFDITRIHKNKW